MPALALIPFGADVAAATGAGFRFGEKGTHATRTMMLEELQSVLAAVPVSASRNDYASAIIEDNCAAKQTVSTRRHTNQRLGELYALDPSVLLFRVLRRLWDQGSNARPQLALLSSLARDPLFAATAEAIVSLEPGAEFLREPMREAIRDLAGDRLNEGTLDKVVRNAASSWTQSGHLEGRALKRRRRVTATAASVVLALYLAYKIGFRGMDLFASGWVATLDCSAALAQKLALEAKRLGLIDIRMAADVVEIGFDRLEQPL